MAHSRTTARSRNVQKKKEREREKTTLMHPISVPQRRCAVPIPWIQFTTTIECLSERQGWEVQV